MGLETTQSIQAGKREITVISHPPAIYAAPETYTSGGSSARDAFVMLCNSKNPVAEFKKANAKFIPTGQANEWKAKVNGGYVYLRGASPDKGSSGKHKNLVCTGYITFRTGANDENPHLVCGFSMLGDAIAKDLSGLIDQVLHGLDKIISLALGVPSGTKGIGDLSFKGWNFFKSLCKITVDSFMVLFDALYADMHHLLLIMNHTDEDWNCDVAYLANGKKSHGPPKPLIPKVKREWTDPVWGGKAKNVAHFAAYAFKSSSGTIGIPTGVGYTMYGSTDWGNAAIMIDVPKDGDNSNFMAFDIGSSEDFYNKHEGAYQKLNGSGSDFKFDFTLTMNALSGKQESPSGNGSGYIYESVWTMDLVSDYQIDPGYFWSHISWDEMKKTNQTRWEALGMTEDDWEGKGSMPSSAGKDWSQLSQNEQAAARSLGYDKIKWSYASVGDARQSGNPTKYYGNFSWSGMSSILQGFWKTLGYSQSLWDSNGNASSTSKTWAQLSVDERTAAGDLGYDEQTWNM